MKSVMIIKSNSFSFKCKRQNKRDYGQKEIREKRKIISVPHIITRHTKNNPLTQMLASDIKYKIIEFFISENEYSNHCDTLQNLLQLNHTIYTFLRKYFLSHSMFNWEQVLNCNDEEKQYLRQIFFDQNISIREKYVVKKVMHNGLDIKVNQLTYALMLPNNLKHIKFGKKFDKVLSQGALPISLTSLKFGPYYDQPIFPGVLPRSLTSLEIGDYFNEPLFPGVLPLRLTNLVFGIWFNKPIVPGTLPLSLTNLTFGHLFNQPLVQSALPSNLTSLRFGAKFNQSLDPGILPFSLTSLTFGYDFDKQLVQYSLPPNLTHMTFSTNYKQPLNALPENLICITTDDVEIHYRSA